jgi:hypothetical protein
MTYQELVQSKYKSQLEYSHLLETDDWKAKRIEILTRDGNKCTKCGSGKSFGPFFSGSNKFYGRKIGDQPILEKSQKFLEIHHIYYIRNLLPWEYEEALITLCTDCHIKTHMEEKIPIYFDYSLTNKILTEACQRCDGTGFLPEFNYYQGGICFGCRGTGMRIPWKD